MKKLHIVLALLLSLLLVGCGSAGEPEVSPELPGESPAGTGISVVISEVMADNRATLADETGDFPDWVELYNPAKTAVTLTGCVLRCGGDQWTLPELTVAGEDYAVLFCSKERTGFGISAKGETLALYAPDGSLIDRFDTPALGEDESATPEGVSALPSPGYPNTREGYAAFQESRPWPTDGPAIGEAMVYNEWYLPQEGAYYDWVEIVNPTEKTLNLADYALSDKKKDRLLFPLSARELAPGERTVILCGGEGEDFAPFGLSAEGEGLYLSRRDGTLCDYVSLRDIPLGCSYGRLAERGGFFYFADPTPGAENRDGARFLGQMPELLGSDGVYNNVSSVTVELTGAGTLRYTLDGSEPTESSPVYRRPLTLKETAVVRVASFEKDALRSPVLSLSYILNENHTLPVVSVAGDPEALFGRNGLYTNPQEDIEIPGAVMFYEEGGAFRRDCGLKLHGETSRMKQEKKSFKLCFRSRYGGELDYDLFENGVTAFSSLLLRAAQEADQSTLMRDNLMHQLALQAFPELPVQDYKYAVLYLNGEYWGVYNIREAHSAAHYARHYGYDEDSCYQWKKLWGEESGFDEVYRFAMTHDLRQDENYEYVAAHLNLESVIGWCVMETYSGNFDFNSPNMRFYYSTEDGKLRYALVDLDLGMFSTESFSNVMNYGYPYTDVAGQLMRNARFREQFCTELGQALAGPLSDENVLLLIDQLAEQLAPEIPRDKERWGGKVTDWEHMVEHLREFITQGNGRASLLVDSIHHEYSLTPAEQERYFGEINQ